MAKRNSQTNRVLNLLRARRGQEVPAYEVAQVGGLQYGARIHALRERGHVILNRVEHHQGQTLSWFKLEEKRPQVEQPGPTPDAPTPTESLFGDIRPDRSYRE